MRQFSLRMRLSSKDEKICLKSAKANSNSIEKEKTKLYQCLSGGVKGPEYTQNLKNLETMFLKHLQNIKNLDYDILDVKITKWHDDYGQYFKEQVKNLETMYHNIIALACKHCSTVEDGVEMIENFDSLAKRPLVKEYVHKKAAEMVYKLFKDEIKEVEDTFE